MKPEVRRGTLLGAELGLLALAVGTAAGFTRLFIGWEFLRDLAPLLVLAWAAAAALRRAHAPVRVALPLHVLVGAVALTVRFAPGTHVWGFPTLDTVEALSGAVESSFSAFSRLVAPVPVSDGFLVVIAAALWLFAFFADTAALRYRGVIQAAVPHVAVFLAIGILARESGRTAAAAWFAAGAACYAIAQLARLAPQRRWVEGHSARGARALAGHAALVVVVALLAAALLGPLLPGSTEPVVDLRDVGRGDGPRTVVSPFVGIRSLLGQRSDQVVFRVTADEPAYWRLTALEQFDQDRQIWVSSGTYTGAGGQLPRTSSTEVGGRPLHQDVEIEGLGGLWLPGAYVPNRIRTDSPVSFDTRSASIIRGEDDSGPVSYTLESTVPDFGGLAASQGFRLPDPTIDEAHLQVPELAPEVQDQLAAVLAGAASDYERMVFLQDWLRDTFTYDETVDYSNELDPLAAFLADRRGFCQQFSSAFALLARAAGVPSRVAVGFTPGDLTEEDGRPTYLVRGRHAHAWPEVHIAGVGWVPFEPTPGRGDPQSERHTGVAPDQADPPEPGSMTSTTAGPDQSDSPPSSAAPAPTTPSAEDPAQDPGSPLRAGDAGTGAAWAWGAAALALLLGVAAVLLVLRRRRDGGGLGRRPDERSMVASAWRDATHALSRAGVVASPSETPLEFAARTASALAEVPEPPTSDGSTDAAVRRVEALEALRRLAEIETSARYREAGLDVSESEQARAAARIVADYSSSLRRSRSLAREPALLK